VKLKVLRYILTKFAWLLLVLLIVMAITFAIFYVFPADPALKMCGKPCTPEQYAKVREFMELDSSLVQQFFDFFAGIFFGRTYGGAGAGAGAAAIICDAPCLGWSFQLSKPVTDLILIRFPITFSIALGSSIIWLVLGSGLGILAARKRGTWLDKLIVGFSVVGVSMPAYLVGLIAVAIFGFNLKLFPTGGYVRFAEDPAQWFWHLLLPWVILAIITAPTYIKLTRAGLLAAFSSDYWRTARAKGLTNQRLFLNHGLRNSALPLVTIFGLNLGSVLSGAVLTETVFSMNGFGKLMIDAVGTHDIPIVLGCTLFSSMIILLANFIVDAVYSLLDPRVALEVKNG
jgi:peptide/nickel transport system permease protein